MRTRLGFVLDSLSTVVRVALLVVMVAFLFAGALQAGDLFVSSSGNDSVLPYDGETGDFLEVFVTPGSGGLDLPMGLTFGPDGNLYVVSNGNNSVIKCDGITGALVGTFVSSGSGGLSFPLGLEFGPDGRP